MGSTSVLSTIVLLGTLGGCRDAAPAEPKELGTWYHARLRFNDLGDLPFFLHVPPPGVGGRAYVVNGDETVDFHAEWRENEVTITAPWNYASSIEAERDKSGALHGTWTRVTPMWGTVTRSFSAKPITSPDPTTRFSISDAAAKVSAAGVWRFQFEEHGEGKGVLQQGADGVVRGYIKPGQLGDIRFLAGNTHGTKLSLSQFNGNVANLVLAELTPDGTSMSGVMSLQNVWNERFTAKKVDDFELANRVHLKDGSKTITLRGLDKYAGKPTLAVIFATWCSSCNDAEPFLVKLYATYHPRGLEMLGVAYDLTDDEKENRAQLDQFRTRYDIPWELVSVQCTPETWVASMPPELEGWDGLPILVLVRADGTVQSVFGGWFGPATGGDGDRMRKAFTDAVEALVTGKPKG